VRVYNLESNKKVFAGYTDEAETREWIRKCIE
jgi:hypothetical protein